ncbi:hypothetical protein TCE0_015r02173 [Talaromyces pinophilus]|uniref:Uncharacterized protein n=1 Tax=Talaromyces pinophilus TaxID=128442 RepID=A0A6V8GZP8_TALPI|nr:hypothetical protein TCE0_015r02173 [Talaromyces pinophilus]
MSTSQETVPPNPLPVNKKSVKRTEIKTDGTGSKLYYHDPVCAYCRAKKIACHHRAIYDEHYNLVRPADEPPKLDDPKPASGQAKKTALKSIPNTIATAAKEGERSAETASTSERPRRANAGKRKLDDTMIEDTATNGPKRQKIEKKKPGRKPRQKTPPIIVVEDTDAAPHLASSPGTEPSDAATEPSNPPAAVQQGYSGNINPSIDMAWNRCMTGLLEKRINETKKKWETLQNTIKEAEKQWEDVQRSMQATKDFMNGWTERWTMSDAFTL